jgi:hypothetical protein
MDLADRVRSLAGFRSHVLAFEGIVNNSSTSLTMTYVGNKRNLPFILRATYAESVLRRNFGMRNIWQAAQFVRDHCRDIDVAVIDVPWPYDVTCSEQQYVIEVPSWLRQEVHLRADRQLLFADAHRSVRGEQMRKIRKNGLSRRISRDPSAIHEFYVDMYVPYIRRRFGDGAIIAPEGRVMKHARSGALLQILCGTEVVAGTVLQRRDNMVRSLWMGMRHADGSRPSGVTSAIYYHTISYAFDEHFRRVDFCGSRPLLSDGVYDTKRRWGAAVYDDFSLESLLIMPNNLNTGVQAFLRACPWIARQGDSLIGKVLLDDRTHSLDDLRRIGQRIGSEGLDAVHLYSNGYQRGEIGHDIGSTQCPVKVFDLQASADPLRTFCDG